jgi:peptidyl-prolyl cis-trans isomerase SurA
LAGIKVNVDTSTMIKNKIAFLSLSILIVTVAYSQPKKVIADKIIAVVGNKIILKSDIDNTIMDMQRQGIDVPADARCMSLEQALGIKALVLQAEKDSLPVTDEEVDAEIDNQVRYFISQYGSKEEVEKIAGKTLYQLKEDFKEGFRDRKLATAMRNKIIEGIKITPNEVRDFYNKIPVDSLPFYETEVEVGQIVCFPKASRDAEEYCIEQLNDYKKQIETGKKDFGTMASIYTEDPGSKERGGMYEINRNQKDLDPLWMSKAFMLKEGQVSNPFKTKFGYHIIQLVSRSGDDAVVRHILKIPQVTNVEMKAGFNKMDTVRSKLIAGVIDFGTAVSRYSDDESSKFTAGMIQGRDGTFLTIDQLDKELVVKMKDLKVGEYSQPLEYTDERGKKGIRIVYLKTKTEPHRENLKDDYNKVAQRALEQKKESALEKWFDDKKRNYYIMIDEEYRNCAALKHWLDMANASAK